MNSPLHRGYPRALPFRAPDEIAAEHERWQEAIQERIDDLTGQAVRLRRWTAVLALALAGTLGLALVAYRTHVVAPTATPPSMAKAPMPAAPPPPPPAPASAPTAPAPAPVVPAAPPTKPVPPKTSLPKEQTLDALGGLSAANLYQSYLTINLLADGVAAKTFKQPPAVETLHTVAGCLNLVDAKLAQLDETALEPDDRASLKQIKAVTALLRLQAQALEASWTDGKLEPSEAFQRTRQASWTGLSKLLGIPNR